MRNGLCWILAATCACVLVLPNSGLAQAPGQEYVFEFPISFDTKGELKELTPLLNRQLQILPDTERFVTATLWQAGSSIVLEVERPDGARARRDMTEQELAQIRQQADRFLVLRRQTSRDQSGRGRFLSNHLLLSIAWYAQAITVIADLQDPGRSSGLFLLTSGAGFYIPYVMTRNARMSRAQQDMCFYASTRGILWGYLVQNLFMEEYEFKDIAPGMLAVSLGCEAAGYVLSRNMTDGQTSLTGTYGDAGMGIGALAGFQTQVGKEHQDGKAVSALTLVGGTAGVALGYKISRGTKPTIGNSLVIRGSSLVGAGLAEALFWAIKGPEVSDEDMQMALGLPMFGGAAGLCFGHASVRGHELTEGDGLIVLGSTVAGAAVGLGVGLLTTGENASDDTRARLYPSLGALCGVAGYLLSLRAVK